MLPPHGFAFARALAARLPRRAGRALGAAALLACVALATPVAAQGYRAALPSFAPLVKQVLPAVVNIAVLQVGAGPSLPPELRGTPFEKQFRDRNSNRREVAVVAGSGFIIDPGGVIVTNNHVIANADRIQVGMQDGTELPAELIGADESTDLAVIQVRPARPLPYVAWGDSRTLEVGDWIVAAGNPFGLGGSVTVGIVSARGRDIGAGPFDDFLQIDAPINHGNSGGPTFNLDGRVVGVNSSIISPSGGWSGIGFAIPSELAARVVAELRSHGRIDRGWLGVAVNDVRAGVVIEGVDRGGPAARSGLAANDVVLELNGERVDSSRQLVREVATIAPGNVIRLTIRRGGREFEVPVTIARRPPQSAE